MGVVILVQQVCLCTLSGLPCDPVRRAQRTRTVDGCRERDFDDPKTGTMIGGHGYCTQAQCPVEKPVPVLNFSSLQELVNLMMFGRAYSNVFDGTKRLGSVKDTTAKHSQAQPTTAMT